jgi:hypothetical protein
VAIGTGTAARKVAHLRQLFGGPLGTLEPDLGFERPSLEANNTEPLPPMIRDNESAQRVRQDAFRRVQTTASPAPPLLR